MAEGTPSIAPRVDYLRYLSDAAGGVVFLLLACAYAIGNGLWDPPTDQGQIVALTLFGLLLASPVGLALNALAWFSVGWTTALAEKALFAAEFPLWMSTRIHEPEVTSSSLLDSPRPAVGSFEWQYAAWRIEKILKTSYPEPMRTLDHIEGLGQFLRSMFLLAVVAVVLSAAGLDGLGPFATMHWALLATFFLIFAGAIKAYQHCCLFSMAYLLDSGQEGKKPIQASLSAWRTSREAREG